MKHFATILLTLACIVGASAAFAKDVLFVATHRDYRNHFLVMGEPLDSGCMDLHSTELEIYYGNLSNRSIQRLPLQLIMAHEAYNILGLDFELPFGSTIRLSIICDEKQWRIEVHHTEKPSIIFLENKSDTALAKYYESQSLLKKQNNHPSVVFGIYSDLESYDRFYAVLFKPFVADFMGYRLYRGHAEQMHETPLKRADIFYHKTNSEPAAVILETLENQVFTFPFSASAYSTSAHHTDHWHQKHLLKRLNLSRNLIDALELDAEATRFDDAGLCSDLFND